MQTMTLDRDARCFLCRGEMKAGEPFRWHLKSGVRGGSRARGTTDRYLPAHVDVLCADRERMAADAAHEQARKELVDRIAAEMIAGRMTPEQAAALLTATTHQVAA